jgi:hypothetical protein
MPTIEFHTYNKETLRDFKPVLASSISPDWWKKAKVGEIVRGVVQQTIRSCPAMDDWLKSGWYLLANRDIEVINGVSKYDSGTSTTATADPHNTSYNSTSHPITQTLDAFEYLGSGKPTKDAFKMRNPWNIKTPPGYSCFYLDPFLFQNNYFATWQGIIDTDEFNVGMDNAQIIFYPKVDHSFVIPKGTPLCQIIPYKRDTWNASYIVNTHESWIKNRATITSEFEDKPTNKSMQEWSQISNFEDETITGFGGYRRGKFWKPKGRFYSEETPPPECPMHNQTEDIKSETQLEFDFDGS